MRTVLDNGLVKIEASDWRYSAAIVGLHKFISVVAPTYDLHQFDNEDYIIYDPNLITKENYTKFLLHFYGDEFRVLKYRASVLNSPSDEESVKRVKAEEKTLPACFKKMGVESFDGANGERIAAIIDANKDELIFESFNKMFGGYDDFCSAGEKANPSRLLSPAAEKKSEINNRIHGFSVDTSRKWTFLSWCNDKKTINAEDCIEFDFIPFGFSKNLSNGRHMFINDNFSIETLISANNFLDTSSSATIALATYLKTIALNNVRYNVQVISKSKESQYQNIYISPATLDVFEAMSKVPNISNLEYFKFHDAADRWFTYETILDYLITGKNLDEIIISTFKLKSDDFAKKHELLHLVILVNDIFYRGGKNLMNERIEQAKKTGHAVANKLEENKVNAYRHKLTSAVATNNQKMVFDILIQLQNYSDITIPFLFYLLDDYNENVNLLYAFMAALKKYSKKEEGEN